MSHVPVVDIAPFRHGGPTDKTDVAGRVDAACRDLGFLVIEGHDVPDYMVSAMYDSAAEYFVLPYWEKMRLKMPPDRYRGYTPYGAETLAHSLDQSTAPDIKESFSIGPFEHACDAYHFGESGARYFAPNIWPARPERMQSIWEAYYSEMSRLAGDLMRIFAVALGMPERWFDDKIDRHITNFSAIHYPTQPAAPSPDQLRAGAHTDYGSLTIVHTNTDVGGLEVRDRSGAWSRVPIVPRTVVVNLGDLMAEWTNDRWVSTLHRVANPPRDQADRTKTSLLFFHQPNYDTVVECLPTCTGPGNPPRYRKTTSGEHATAKIEKHRTL
ncbi:MAG: isopenicillin N synthase family dioxygenase [Gammaproteobacteria bacterium]